MDRSVSLASAVQEGPPDRVMRLTFPCYRHMGLLNKQTRSETYTFSYATLASRWTHLQRSQAQLYICAIYTNSISSGNSAYVMFVFVANLLIYKCMRLVSVCVRVTIFSRTFSPNNCCTQVGFRSRRGCRIIYKAWLCVPLNIDVIRVYFFLHLL